MKLKYFYLQKISNILYILDRESNKEKYRETLGNENINVKVEINRKVSEKIECFMKNCKIQ